MLAQEPRDKRTLHLCEELRTHDDEICADTSMRRAKQIVFRYSDDPTTEEIDLDMDGEKSTP
jgi:hypothetical protein